MQHDTQRPGLSEACSNSKRAESRPPRRGDAVGHALGRRAGAAGDLDRDVLLRPGHPGAGHPAGALHQQPGALTRAQGLGYCTPACTLEQAIRQGRFTNNLVR